MKRSVLTFDKFKGDAVKLAQEFTPEIGALHLELDRSRPRDNARSGNCAWKPLPFKPSGGGGKGGKGGRGNRGRDNNRRGGYRGDRNRDDLDGGRRDFKRKSKKNTWLRKPWQQTPAPYLKRKENGFVIRNKGDK